MNRLYIGFDNPLSILARSIPSEQLTITAEGAGITLRHDDDYHYTARVTTPGEARITLDDGNGHQTKYLFVAKRMPDNQPLLGSKYNSGDIISSVFKEQSGIGVIITGFGFEARCTVESYVVTRIAKRYEGNALLNKGARFEPHIQQLIDLAAPGDQYFFDDIMARCPGDESARNLGGLIFKIK